jgi:hypothetical protein
MLPIKVIIPSTYELGFNKIKNVKKHNIKSKKKAQEKK